MHCVTDTSATMLQLFKNTKVCNIQSLLAGNGSSFLDFVYRVCLHAGHLCPSITIPNVYVIIKLS